MSHPPVDAGKAGGRNPFRPGFQSEEGLVPIFAAPHLRPAKPAQRRLPAQLHPGELELGQYGTRRCHGDSLSCRFHPNLVSSPPGSAVRGVLWKGDHRTVGRLSDCPSRLRDTREHLWSNPGTHGPTLCHFSHAFLVDGCQSATMRVRAPKPGAQKVALWRSEVFPREFARC
jgi:hypothetical protein